MAKILRIRTHRPDAGFSLAALIFFATAASIFIAAAVPSYQMQAKREVEEELIFRGEEYARAIQKYQRRFGVYPSSVDQLLSTNGVRFLRKAYKDPVTGKDFRLITLNPGGSLTGSKLFQQDANTQPLFGNTSAFQQQPQAGPQRQTRTQQFQSLQQSPQQGGGQPGLPPAGLQAQTSAAPPASGLTTGIGGSALGVFRVGGGVTSPIAAGGIVGVASDSSEKSIKVYNGREEYDEWEFLAILGQQALPGQQGNAQPRDPNQQQNPQGFPGLNGPRPPNAPTPPNTLQPQPNPFGRPTIPGQIPSPFSLGGAPQQAPAQPRGRR